jgi:hypothetical protein
MPPPPAELQRHGTRYTGNADYQPDLVVLPDQDAKLVRRTPSLNVALHFKGLAQHALNPHKSHGVMGQLQPDRPMQPTYLVQLLLEGSLARSVEVLLHAKVHLEENLGNIKEARFD